MNGILEFKGQLQNFYSRFSRYINMLFKFVLALICFSLINQQLGFFEMLTNPLITMGLSALSAVLPAGFIVLAAIGLIIGHAYGVSLWIMAVTAVVFLIIIVFYLRLAPKKGVVLVLMLIAHIFGVPLVIPVACGLLAGLECMVPVACGTITYYVIEQIKASKDLLGAAEEEAGFITEIMEYAKAVMTNKEMWLVAIAGMVCVLMVYGVRRSGIIHAWKFASVLGILVYIVVMAAGSTVLEIDFSYSSVFAGAIAALIAGLLLELVFHSVNYRKTETLEFEDDDYYYYVKAIPKVGISKSSLSKTSGRDRDNIQELDEDDFEKPKKRGRFGKKESKAERATEVSSKKPVRDDRQTEQELLTKSLKKDLNLEDE